MFNLGISDVLLIILSVILLFSIIIINKTYSKKDYNDELNGITREYKKYVDENNKNTR